MLVRPRLSDRLLIRIDCETVLNAVEGSRKMRMLIWPESAAM